MTGFLGILPTIIALLVMIGVSILINRNASRSEGGFVKNYFIGNRGLGGFVLAMTSVATYSSVSSFVGGPGQAYSIGFGWVFMSVVQVTSMILVFGILGKKMAVISRKANAVTIIDVIRYRYKSDALSNISAFIIVLFFATTMIAQFVGGANLFSAVTGLPYTAALAIFGITVVIFTAIGGFRGVAITDTICAILMLVGMVILITGILHAGGGYGNIMDNIAENKPELLEPFSAGNMPLTLYISQWLLVGIFTLGLPQTVVRTISFKDSKSMHSAIIVGTIVVGAMNLGMNFIGVMSNGILDGPAADLGGTDNIIPLSITQSLNPILAGIVIIAPIAASISTISSLLIMSTSSIVKDIYLYQCEKKGKEVKTITISVLSRLGTIILGAIVFLLSISPPDVIWKINMFAFGGLESAFVCVLIFGLFWKGANKYGAILSIICGTASYCICTFFGVNVFGVHQIVIGMGVALAAMLIGSLAKKSPV